MRKIIATLHLLFLLALPLTAYPGEGAPALTLDECVKAALANNHVLLAESEKLEAAKAGVGKAESSFMPRLDLSETYMRSDNPVMSFGAKLDQGRFTAADFDPSKLNSPHAIDNFNFRVQITQPVFNGGKEWVGMKRAKLGLGAAGDSYSRSRQETVYRVVQAYYGVALAGEYVKVAGMAKDTTEAHVKLAQDFYNQGMLVGSEVLLAKVRLAEVTEMLIKAKNQEATARAALNMILARPQDTDFRLAGTLGYVDFPATLTELQDEAVKDRPDLAGMDKTVENMGEGIRLARTDYLPILNFIARYDLDDRTPFAGDGNSYTLLGMLTWNVFDGFLTTNSVREASAGYNASRHMLDQMKEGVLFEVRQAYNNLDEARQRIEVAKTAVDEGEESLRIIQRRFEAGLTKTLDVLDAETALTRARTNKAQALYDYNVELAQLKLAAGRMEY